MRFHFADYSVAWRLVEASDYGPRIRHTRLVRFRLAAKLRSAVSPSAWSRLTSTGPDTVLTRGTRNRPGTVLFQGN